MPTIAKIFLCFAAFAKFSITANCQNIDSLLAVLKNLGSDSIAAAPTKVLLGYHYFKKGNLDSAETLYQQAMHAAAHSSNDTLLIQAYNGCGNVCADKGENQKALGYFQKAFAISDKLSNNKFKAETNKNIGAVYLSMKQQDVSLKYYQEAKQNAINAKDPILEADINNNLGTVYEMNENYPEAINLYKTALKTYESFDRKDKMAMALGNLAIVYKYQKKWNNALHANFRGLELAKQRNSKWTEAAVLNNIGNLYNSMKKYDSSIYYSNKAIAVAREMNALEIIYNTYENMAEASVNAGLSKEANDYFKQAIAVKDSFINTENTKEIAALETKFQTAKKDKEIAVQNLQLTRRKYQMWAMAAASLLLLYMLYNRYQRNRLKQEKRMQEQIMQEKELATIGILKAEENERSRIGADLHDGVGQYLTAAKMNLEAYINEQPAKPQELGKIKDLLLQSANEVRLVSHNLMPAELHKKGLDKAIREFVSKLAVNNVKIDFYSEGMEGEIDANIESVIYRIIQEAINNALKHSNATRIDVSMAKEANKLSITIEDNGVGFDKTQTSDGIGMGNIASRVNYLKGELDIDTAPGKGTLIALHVPLA